MQIASSFKEELHESVLFCNEANITEESVVLEIWRSLTMVFEYEQVDIDCCNYCEMSRRFF